MKSNISALSGAQQFLLPQILERVQVIVQPVLLDVQNDACFLHQTYE